MVITKVDKKLISHLFRRAGFGTTEDEINKLADKSYEDLVDDLLSPEKQPEIAEDILRRYHLELNFPDTHGGWQSYWIYRMINTARPLEEKMALFWHQVFATGNSKVDNGNHLTYQIQMFREHGTGNYRDLLIKLAQNPAMIYWLDNHENHKRAPNENWGRELLELFSIRSGKLY